MIPFLTKLQPGWISLTFRQPRTAATAAPRVSLCTSPPEPVIPSKKPIKVELLGGKRYSWCSCGHSRKQVARAEPVIPSKKPIKVELFGGKRYSWCSCGHSSKQPFCDGAHKTRAQVMTPLRFVPQKDSTVWLCGCKHTSNPPYCDGTHKQDFIVSAPLHECTD